MSKLDLTKITLGSSNLGKLKEYNSFGLNISSKSIPDLKEVLGTDEEVIIYKALSVEENILVEDTTLNVEGFDVGVNVKYLTEDLKVNPKYHSSSALWTVLLGVVQNGILFLAKGEIRGNIDSTSPKAESFGFDSVFIPKGQDKSLHELNMKGQKGNFSARKLALDNLISKNYYKTLLVKDIPLWTGEYQNS